MSESREQRIDRERQEMGLRVWEFAPSEVHDGPNPYAANPSSAGAMAWQAAVVWRAEIRQRDPRYFG